MGKDYTNAKIRLTLNVPQRVLTKAQAEKINLSDVLTHALDSTDLIKATFDGVDRTGVDLIRILGKPKGFFRCTGKIFYDDSNALTTGCAGIYYPYWSDDEADMHFNHWHSYKINVERNLETYKAIKLGYPSKTEKINLTETLP